MASLLDLCRFIPTLGGTTDFVYSSAVGGCQSPAAAGIVNGVTYRFYGVSADLTQWEISSGAYNTGTGTASRTTVLYNSSGTGTAAGQSGAGTKINFSTVPQVSVVALAEDLTVTTAAAKSDQQAGSSAILAVTPSQQQQHASAAKAWLHYQGTGTPAILASYNVASVTRNSAGVYTITWTTPFSSANYAVVCTSNDNGSGVGMLCAIETISAASVQIIVTTSSTLGAVDAAHISVVAFGAQ